MIHKRILIAAALGLALVAAACGSESKGDAGNGAAAGGSDLAISAPEDGADVSLPFTLELDAAEPLGAPDTGDHHVHVFYDGDDSEYEVVTSDTFQVTDLSPGDHTITASLRNADHSPAGTDVTINVTVTGGGEGEGGSDNSGSGSNKYGNSGEDDSGDGSDDSGGGGNYGY
jgi:hypothetical protein